MEIYQSINEWAKNNKITKKEIAETLEIKPQQYSRQATGKRKYTAEQIKKIAEKYNVSADTLLGIELSNKTDNE